MNFVSLYFKMNKSGSSTLSNKGYIESISPKSENLLNLQTYFLHLIA